MALLDVSEVIEDPLFTSPCALIKTVESTDANGEPAWADGETAEINAVVTSDQKTIDRLPEALRRAGTIIVRCVSDMAPEGFGAAYDAVLWHGKRFVVKDCADYSQFGRGFLRLVCWPEEAGNGRY